MDIKSSGKFKHVNFLWDQQKADAMHGNEVDLLVYRSNLLGADLRLTNYGGGNTSCKAKEKDPLTGNETAVLWVKGSGGDLGTMTRQGLASLYLDRFQGLKNIYRGLEYEDEMVELYNHCLFDLHGKPPSIDTPLHGLLPFRHIDHLHPDAVISIAAARDGEGLTRKLSEGKLGWVKWQRPGFDLGLKIQDYQQQHPGIRGIVLGSHGLFTWGESSRDCYLNTLQVVEMCADFQISHSTKSRPVFGGIKGTEVTGKDRQKQASAIIPWLRGYCSTGTRKIGHFSDDDRVLEFINSADLDRLAPLGTSCPDHFLRTKISPLVLRLPPDQDPGQGETIRGILNEQFEDYRRKYIQYYHACKHPGSPPMRDPDPVVLLYPGIGMFTFASSKLGARIASEFYINAINVMKGAEAVSEYTALPEQEAFDIEYWLLEEAKLRRMPAAGRLSGRVALITGSGGGIGRAIARKMAEEGACIVISDIDPQRLAAAEKEFRGRYGHDACIALPLDVTQAGSVEKAFDAAALAFGGVDILVNCAGLSVSKPLEDHTEQDWDMLYDILVKGQFLITRAGLKIMRKQDFGGDIINIVSKNALVSGPDNAAYGSAKAAQLHLSRLNAAELGKDRIRVNVVNPDAVITDSHIWTGAWAEGRARAYGISVAELPAFYAKRTLLGETINPEDIANACLVFIGGLLNKSTGNVLNVDGGLAAAFVR